MQHPHIEAQGDMLANTQTSKDLGMHTIINASLLLEITLHAQKPVSQRIFENRLKHTLLTCLSVIPFPTQLILYIGSILFFTKKSVTQAA